MTMSEMMNTRPQTLGYSLADSPVGMLAFYYEKFTEWTHSDRQPEEVLTQDDMLDNVTLYWLTNTGTSSSRSYWDAAQGEGGPFNAFDIQKVPVAVTIFPGEIYRAPRAWGEQAFKKMIYWNRSTRAVASPRLNSRSSSSSCPRRSARYANSTKGRAAWRAHS